MVNGATGCLFVYTASFGLLNLKLRELIIACSTLSQHTLHYSYNGKCLGLYSPSVLPLRLSPLTEDTSMITVSSCGVKLQKVVSDLEKELDIHMHFCGFSQHSFNFFISTWGVISRSKLIFKVPTTMRDSARPHLN